MVPPAPNGTMSRIGRSGYGVAAPAAGTAAAHRPSAANKAAVLPRTRLMLFMVVSSLCRRYDVFLSAYVCTGRTIISQS
ncbi:Uncharacterised protein [Bordetella pertussis]|nr:Uncharacterised protein [Bordetella pertussis]